MNEETRRSILQMARGAILERADYETTRILDNILDPNTAATAKRKMTMTVTFVPDGDRQTIAVSCEVKSALAPTHPVMTSLYVADGQNILEMVPQVPGQYSMDGVVQEPPAMLKIVDFK